VRSELDAGAEICRLPLDGPFRGGLAWAADRCKRRHCCDREHQLHRPGYRRRHAAASVFAVPLAIRIHEGVVWSNRDRRTLLDKMLALLGIVAIAQPCCFVADAYYAARKIVIGLLKDNNHLLVTRVKSNAVAYTPYQQRGPRKRGRPKVYDHKVKLKSRFCRKYF